VATTYSFVVELVGRDLGPETRVLDIGCGAQQYRALLPGVYHGLDPAPATTELPHYRCSAESIPCPKGVYDVVFGVASFSIIRDVARAFAECQRVLKTGGRLLVFDYQRREGERLLAGGHVHAWSFPELRGLLENAGFGAVRNLSARAYDNPALRLAARVAPAALGLFGASPIWLIAEAHKS